MEKVRKPTEEEVEKRPRGRPPLNRDAPRRPVKAVETARRKPRDDDDEPPRKGRPAVAKNGNGEYPYGVREFAKELGISEPSARRVLRDLSVKKPGKKYGWPTMEKLRADVKRAG